MSGARIPATRPPGLTYGRPEIAALQMILTLHDRAECDMEDCPALRFRTWLAQLEQTLLELGDDTRAQIWASLQVTPVQPPLARVVHLSDGPS